MSAIPVRSTRPTVRARELPPTLTLVSTAPVVRRRFVPTLGVILLLILTILVSLVFRAKSAAAAYDIQKLERELLVLEDEYQSMTAQALQSKSPQELARRAHELGLVQAGDAGTITLATSEVVPGTPAK
ncbi:hypothetical protein [Buchananella hordeovulneris]|uniref:Cell division protein FtsL n=1 Tax=Buchananella hordeovulneris TaxID=52770 RepID=A0A1Q5PVB1_9ACTO|nr:hypothetical protein [Buchananella hordeovulneris]MDO5080583.1 hypothetical protein [Buchananella hordeovulneris]OKL51534.1 hypothetical protein BSZ40_06725 [Buchananella hordeovulneris]RRD44078.1 hypothetical protein EII13_05055 [Buchananella hordeovulneris]RRD53639.1 hypothetical protein EII12_01165 [Buchananella hordeovulneris]